MNPGFEPIADEELLYRRIAGGATPPWYDPATQKLNAQAFAPHKLLDQTGLSVYRSKYKSIEEAARGRLGKQYYVAILCAGDLRRHGFRIEPRPDTSNGFDPAHAELPDLNSGNRKDDKTLQRQQELVELCCEVKGPYETDLDK